MKSKRKRHLWSAFMEKRAEAARSIMIEAKKRAYIRRKAAKMRRNNKVKVGDDISSNDTKLVSKFLKNAHEDILFEVFLRLTNCRSAILFGSICRRWHSVISHPKFIPNFIRHHHDEQDRYSVPYTILFRRADDLFFDMQCLQPFCKLFSEESKFLHGKGASSYLDFMPSSVVIRASFADLLLVASSGRRGRDYYICNPLTKQWFKLPEAPRGSQTGFALVCIPNISNSQLGFSINGHYEYKVVLIQSSAHNAEDCSAFRATIFCSKLGKWSQSHFLYPPAKKDWFSDYVDVVTCNGILYWREDTYAFDIIVAFDLFNDQCRVIDFPDDFGSVWQNSYGKVHLGAVRGELRLLQVFSTNEDCFVMKIWELNYSTSWDLVHEIYLKRPRKTKSMVGLAVHPDNSNVVFMIWDKHVFQYKIKEDMYKKVDKLQVSINAKVDWLLDHLDGKFEKIKLAVNTHERFSTFPLLHPAWPTPVPSHPPSF